MIISFPLVIKLDADTCSPKSNVHIRPIWKASSAYRIAKDF